MQHETTLEIPEAILAPRPPAAVLDERDTIVAQANALEVKDGISFGIAGALLRDVKRLRKGIAGYFEPIRAALRTASDNLSTKIREADDPLARAEEILKGKIGGFEQEERARKAEELKKAVSEAKTPDGEIDLEKVLAAAAEASKKTKAAGVSTRTLWSAQVDDLEKLLRWVLEDFSARSLYVTANGSALSAEARKLKERLAIPGVSAVSETSVAGRA